MSEIIITTCDVKQNYQVLCPICVQISNNVALCRNFNKLIKEYQNKSNTPKDNGASKLLTDAKAEKNKFEQIFFIGVEELKKRAQAVGANAIIGMRQDFEIGENDYDYFYLQIYGTAVKFI